MPGRRAKLSAMIVIRGFAVAAAALAASALAGCHDAQPTAKTSTEAAVPSATLAAVAKAPGIVDAGVASSAPAPVAPDAGAASSGVMPALVVPVAQPTGAARAPAATIAR